MKMNFKNVRSVGILVLDVCDVFIRPGSSGGRDLFKKYHDVNWRIFGGCRHYSDSSNPANPQLPLKRYLTVQDPSKGSVAKSSAEPSQHIPHLDRNFITGYRAQKDFCLQPKDLDGLRRTTRRSPNEHDPPLNVYWRKDVMAKSLQVWGSIEKVDQELARRNKEHSEAQLKMGLFKRLFSRHNSAPLSRENWPVRGLSRRKNDDGLNSESGKVVLTAIGINTANFVVKLVACVFTGSHALFSEAIHSLADTANQIILAYGIRKSMDSPTMNHPYGYSNMQYVSSLISGTGIFCIGAGVSVYHGVTGLFNPHELSSMTLALVVLGGSFLSESVTLILAIKSIKQSALKAKMGFLEYVSGGYDPSVNVVLLEDIAAVMGVGIAGLSMGLSVYLNSHIPDAVGCICVGGLLGSVASFMIYTNSNALVGRSIPDEKLVMINKRLEGDLMVRQVHDVKGIDMGNGITRYKAELDIDGRELARYYLQKQELNHLLTQVKGIKTQEDIEHFMLKHGESMVDCLGEQVDRIEMEIRREFPEVRHMDLEVL